MMKVPIKASDAAWFFVEKQGAPAHFGPLIIMTPPKNAPKSFVRDLVAQWRSCNQGYAPPFNYRLSLFPVPRWEVLPDHKVDLEYHLRHSALPAPGGEKELGELVSRLHTHPLEREKPLWECHIIEGLEGGRFALYLKLHHGQLDGMGAVRLMQRVFSTSSRTRKMPPPWMIGMANRRHVAGSKQPRKLEEAKRVKTKKTADTSHTLFDSLTKKVKTLSDVSLQSATFFSNAYGGQHPELGAPFKAPSTRLNGRIHSARRYATQRYELARLKAITKAANVTLNDVFLSICGGALRRYLMENDDLPDNPLIGQVPVSIRPAGDSSIGNALAFIYASLATHIADPVERLYAVHESSESGKSVHEALPREAIEPFTMLMLTPFISQVVFGLGGHLPPAANLVISNVRGPSERLYFNGARVEQIYGPSVLFHGQALNITMSTYADEVNIGFTGCRDSLPSMQKLAVYTGEALAELEKALDIDSSAIK